MLAIHSVFLHSGVMDDRLNAGRRRQTRKGFLLVPHASPPLRPTRELPIRPRSGETRGRSAAEWVTAENPLIGAAH